MLCLLRPCGPMTGFRRRTSSSIITALVKRVIYTPFPFSGGTLPCGFCGCAVSAAILFVLQKHTSPLVALCIISLLQPIVNIKQAALLRAACRSMTLIAYMYKNFSRSPDSRLKRLLQCLLGLLWPNDWLSPTYSILDAHGSDKRGLQPTFPCSAVFPFP